jgi:hypothetical protein
MSDKPAEEAAKDAAKPEPAAGDDAAKAAAEKAAAEKAATEKAAAEKAAAEKAATEKAAAEKAAAEKAAAEKAAAEKAAAEKAAAEEAAAAAEKAARAKAAKQAPAGAARGKLLLVAWGPSPAAAWEAQLAHAGFEVYVERSARLSAFQWAQEHSPVAAVIDLSQNPDDGRRLASTMRITGATAGIPLVFCDAVGGGAAPLASVEAVLGALSKL